MMGMVTVVAPGRVPDAMVSVGSVAAQCPRVTKEIKLNRPVLPVAADCQRGTQLSKFAWYTYTTPEHCSRAVQCVPR